MLANKIYSSQEFTETDIQKLNLNDEDLIERLCDEGIWINSELAETLKSYNNCILIGRSEKMNV